jgi:NAD(P)-dependent dehydrogenase (short-subunit alcohol dehydrogenase family)
VSAGGALDGLVALVTGGSSGLGAATVRLFASEGARVYSADVNAKGEDLAASLRDERLDVRFVALDVTSEDAWEAAIAEVTADGGLDILVNNAGLSGVAAVDSMDVGYWRRLLDVNLTGPFLGIRAARSALAASSKAAVVNVSSIAGVVGVSTTHLGYSASKGGLRIMTKTAAIDLAAEGIRLNSIHPGSMPPMAGSQWSPDSSARANLEQSIPLRRTGTYEEVAQGILYLASPAASYVTGAELYVDGGYLAR